MRIFKLHSKRVIRVVLSFVLFSLVESRKVARASLLSRRLEYLRSAAEWSSYLECSHRPRVREEKELNTYISSLTGDDCKCMETALKITEEVEAVVGALTREASLEGRVSGDKGREAWAKGVGTYSRISLRFLDDYSSSSPWFNKDSPSSCKCPRFPAPGPLFLVEYLHQGRSPPTRGGAPGGGFT